MLTLVNVIIVGFLIMLSVLGHGAWHSQEVMVANFIVNLFTGAHVVG